MDWQHLIMNGENLAEYAALLAAEGLLGHQHANSGWGTFDDDNMVGATAFMETLELAIELRRVGYGDNGERLGFDLYPYTEDAVGAVKRSVLQWRFIDGVAAHDRRGRAAGGATDEGRRPRLRARLRSAGCLTRLTSSIGLDVGTSGVKGVAISPRRRRARDRRGGATRSRRPGRAGPSRIPRTGGARRRRARAAARRARSASPGRCTGSSCSTTPTGCCGRRSSGTTSAPPPSARRSSAGSGSSG